MKYLLIALLFTSLVSCSGSDTVEVGNKTTMEIDKVFDAGTVVKGEMITAKFKLENTGSYPLVIAEVKGSCSCTVAEYPEEPIAPGETAEIMAHVNTDKTGAGIINKSVRVVANTKPSITQLQVKASVRAR